MANPTAGDMAKMKRIARYVKNVPRVMLRAGTQAEDVGMIVTCVDSDWAGCRGYAEINEWWGDDGGWYGG